MLGKLNVADAEGDEALADLANSVKADTATLHNAVQVVRQAEASRALVPARTEPSLWDIGGFGISRLIQARTQEIEREYKERAQPVSPAPAAEPHDRIKDKQDREQGREWWTEPRDLSPDEFDDDELAEIDERAREIVEDEDEPDTPPSPPETREDGLRRIDPKQLYRLSASERLAAARRRAAEEFAAEREAVLIEEAKRTRSLQDILASNRPDAQAPSRFAQANEPEPVLSWFERWFGKQKKAIWK